RLDRREIDTGTHLAAAASSVDEMQHVSLVVDTALEKARDQLAIDALENLRHARMDGDRARRRMRARQAVDGARRDAAPRELEREHRPRRAAADDQNLGLAVAHDASPRLRPS